jgi:hypothetical protein
MMKKLSKKDKGPSWFEVGLGAVLSVILGAALGAAYMINKPVIKVTAIPKDAPAGAVYLIEGAKDLNRTGIMDKRRAFAGGDSMVVDESEINGFFASIAKPSAPAPAAPKPGDKSAPAAADQKVLDLSTVNARIREGKIQFSDTATVTVLGVSVPVIVQASGIFRKSGSEFEFDPDTLYVGGCPMQRMLFFRSWILKKLLFAQPAPDDVAAAWSKLVDVSIEGTKLRLKAP